MLPFLNKKDDIDSEISADIIWIIMLIKKILIYKTNFITVWSETAEVHALRFTETKPIKLSDDNQYEGSETEP